MGDDAAGLDAVRCFEEAYGLPEGVDLLDGGTLGLDLLAHLEGYAGVLVADAMTRGGSPGQVYRIGKEEVDAAFAESLSAHQVGLRDLFALLELQGRTPERLAVIGVEPQTVEPGVGLSAAVEGALAAMASALAAELAAWGVTARPRERARRAPDPALAGGAFRTAGRVSGPAAPSPGGGRAARLLRR